MYIHISKLSNYQNRLVQSSDIIVEFALKNGAECIYIFVDSQNYQNRLVQLPNRHHKWIHIEKRVPDIYHTSSSAIAIEIYSNVLYQPQKAINE
jgi:hypothetical protein